MSKARIIFIFGVWVAILPYLGFPTTWKSILFTLTGLVLIYFSYTFHQKNSKSKEKQEINFDNFRENHDFRENNSEEGREEQKENII